MSACNIGELKPSHASAKDKETESDPRNCPRNDFGVSPLVAIVGFSSKKLGEN
jgi:hypothetical protein